MMPTFVALFAVSAYFVYLKANGAEVPDSFLLETLFLVIAVGCALGMTLNELLLWRTGGRFRAKRLVFRLALGGSYFGLLVGLYALLLTLLPWMSTGSMVAISAAAAAWIFIAIALRKRSLFSRLDKAE